MAKTDLLALRGYLPAGARVRSVTRYRRGERGTVKERLNDRLDGMGAYVVALDSCPELETHFVRAELARVKKGGR